MKQIYTLILCTMFSCSLFAQLPVSEVQTTKKAVLEEFTGIACVFCPDGHKVANAIKDANPGDFFPVNIHTGGFASPQGAGTDFRTADGDAIANQSGMGITGYPQGAMNRRLWNGSAAMAHSRGDWTGNANSVLNEMSYVNVAGDAVLNVETRELTIDIEAFYTAEGAPETNKYTVMLLQDNINGPQTGGATYNPDYVNADGSYRHNHMLRDVLNSTTLGDEIATTTMGSKFTTSLTYTIPADYAGVSAELADLSVLVFVSETNTNIMTAANVPIELTGFTTAKNAAVENLQEIAETCINVITPAFRLRNMGSEDLTSAEITYSVNGETTETFNWTGVISPLGNESITLPEVTFTLQENNSLEVAVGKVNDGDDEDTSNNNAMNTFSETSSIGNSVNLNFDITQDRYGSETTWFIYDETGATVAQGGPYSDLGANGTVLHEELVTVPAMGCYSVEILDSYGDGINSGYGVGKAELTDGFGDLIWSTNGVFSTDISQQYTITSNTTVNIDELIEEGFSVYPNPVSDNLNIEFDAKGGSYSLQIVDMTGRAMFAKSLENINGQQNISVPVNEFAKGMYIVDIVKDGQKFTQRIMVQ